MSGMRAVQGALKRAPLERVAAQRITSTRPDALLAVADMAATYPLPHNVLGTQAARSYALRLAEHPQGSWYGLFSGERLHVAAHLALYGQGDGVHHSLWKIRHPLTWGGLEPVAPWSQLLESLVGEALRVRPGSVKVVLFLSEHEREAGHAARQAGFTLEGCLRDFYRLEETCLIYGRTARSSPRFQPSTSIPPG